MIRNKKIQLTIDLKTEYHRNCGRFFFGCKPGILHAQLQRLILRALWDPNGRQILPKSFNAAACPRLDSNL